MNTNKAAKLIRMLSSTADGEVLAAARQLNAMGIHEIAGRIENSETATRNGVPLDDPDQFLAGLDRRTDQFISQYKKWDAWAKSHLAENKRLAANNKCLREELDRLVKSHLAETDRLGALAGDLKLRLAKFRERACVVCGISFLAGRSDATTCSPRCRVALHRRKQRNA